MDYYSHVRKDMTHFLPKDYGKVLDVGCGRGCFRKSLSPSCDYLGVEPFTPEAEAGISEGTKILIGTYEQVESQIPKSILRNYVPE